jgi:hypothetical protein
MKNCRTLLLLICFPLFSFLSYAQQSNTQQTNIKVEVAKSKDLRRTAYRYRISVGQLANARSALKEATDLALRQDPPVLSDYTSLGRLWVQLDRKNATSNVASMIEQVCRQAQVAEDLASYRRYTTPGQQLLYLLLGLDIEKARQIADLWPAPPAKLGDAGQQALLQFQTDFNSRLIMQAPSAVSEQVYEQLLQSQKSSSIPLTNRITLAQSLINLNQKDKARAVLDQAIADLGQAAPEPGKTGEYESFLRMLASVYPEKSMSALDAYRAALARLGPSGNPGAIYQIGDQRITLDPSESTALSMLRGMYGRPELAMKLLDANPGLRAKLDQIGGVDNFLNPPQLSGIPTPMPILVAGPTGSIPPNPPPPPEKPANPSDLLRTLRGKADSNPELVRRKLSDTYLKKEGFQSLITLAQMATYSDPELSDIALEVAHGLLPLFDSLNQRATSLRSLITALRQCDGEVDPTLLKEGLILVGELREEENQKAQAVLAAPGAVPPAVNVNPPPNPVVHPSDDLEITLIAQTALDDFGSALRSAHSIKDEGVRIRALMQIVQSLINY